MECGLKVGFLSWLGWKIQNMSKTHQAWKCYHVPWTFIQPYLKHKMLAALLTQWGSGTNHLQLSWARSMSNAPRIMCQKNMDLSSTDLSACKLWKDPEKKACDLLRHAPWKVDCNAPGYRSIGAFFKLGYPQNCNSGLSAFSPLTCHIVELPILYVLRRPNFFGFCHSEQNWSRRLSMLLSNAWN